MYNTSEFQQIKCLKKVRKTVKMKQKRYEREYQTYNNTFQNLKLKKEGEIICP